MVFTDNMWSDDEFPVLMFVKPRDEDFLIGLPTAACNKDFLLIAEGFNDRQLLRSFFDLQHTVETGVSHNGDTMDAYLCQQFTAHLILHIEMGEALQHMTILPAIPLKEHLVGTEDATDTIYWNVAVLQDM